MRSPVGSPRDGRRESRAGRLLRAGGSAGTREALTVWLATRTALVAFSLVATWVLGLADAARERTGGTPLTGSTAWFLERFTWWDSFHFLRIADVGYLPPDLPCCDQAFLPGYPAAIAAVAPLLGGDLAVAGVVVSVVTSALAAVLLWHLAEQLVGSGAGRVAVLLLAVAPYGFFLTAVYSEATFLALAVGAWLAGLRGHRLVAGLLAAAGTATRINGLFLTAGLAVMLLVQLHADGRLPSRRAGAGDGPGPVSVRRSALTVVRAGWPLVVPVLTYVAWTLYLWRRTGSPDAWQEAQRTGWDRRVAAPWTGLADGVTSLLDARAPSLVVSRFADLLFAVLGIVLVAVLLRRRRWAEAAYMLPSAAVLVCSTTLISTPRYALLWFPGYLLLAGAVLGPSASGEGAGWRAGGPAGHRPRPWLVPALGLVAVPWLALVTLSFSMHLWMA